MGWMVHSTIPTITMDPISCQRILQQSLMNLSQPKNASTWLMGPMLYFIHSGPCHLIHPISPITPS